MNTAIRFFGTIIIGFVIIISGTFIAFEIDKIIVGPKVNVDDYFTVLKNVLVMGAGFLLAAFWPIKK